MDRIKIRSISIGITIILVLTIGAWQLTKILTATEPLSVTDATSKVQDLYNGKIMNVFENKGAFEVTMEMEKGTYVVKVDRHSGNIEQVSRINENTSLDQNKDIAEGSKDGNPEGTEREPNKQEKRPDEKGKFITKKEAAAIALQNVNGKVDDMEDIELEESGGNTYYLVEVEREHAEDGTVQINAITGEVKAIYWED